MVSFTEPKCGFPTHWCKSLRTLFVSKSSLISLSTGWSSSSAPERKLNLLPAQPTDVELTCDELRFREKVKLVLRATRHHATNLARFATIYKLTMLALKYFGAEPGKEGTSSSPEVLVRNEYQILTIHRYIRLLRRRSCWRLLCLWRSIEAHGKDLISQPADRHLRLCARSACPRTHRRQARSWLTSRII